MSSVELTLDSNTMSLSLTFAFFPDVEELVELQAVEKQELRTLQRAVEAKEEEIGQIQDELDQYKRLKNCLPPLF